MTDRLKAVIASFLDLELGQFEDSASPATISAWDSVKQIDIMLGVEEEFKVRFRDEEIATLTSYVAIRDALRGRGAIVA